MVRSTAGAILFLVLGIATAHAAPFCERPPQARQSVTPVNGFAGSPPPTSITTSRAHCAWAVGLAQPPTGTGTAFIVGNRREVMTNLHVADKGCRGNRHFVFDHGFDKGHSLSKISATVVINGDYCAKLARGQHDYSGDWAIAVLEEDPAELEGTASANARPLQPATGAPGGGTHYLLGYSMSYRSGVQPYRSAACRFGKLFSSDVVQHDCDASHRTSGAPILNGEAFDKCVVTAIHVGELQDVPGRPPYREGVNANVAVLASRFAPAVRAVARLLKRGYDADQIAADLARHPPH
jgi:V8-like Glu-specific endopeptidase